MIKEASISYCGLNYVEHAEADFMEMKAHGVTQVVPAWACRGSYGTVVGAPDALELWDNIGRNYKRVCKRRQ